MWPWTAREYTARIVWHLCVCVCMCICVCIQDCRPGFTTWIIRGWEFARAPDTSANKNSKGRNGRKRTMPTRECHPGDMSVIYLNMLFRCSDPCEFAVRFSVTPSHRAAWKSLKRRAKLCYDIILRRSVFHVFYRCIPDGRVGIVRFSRPRQAQMGRIKIKLSLYYRIVFSQIYKF